MSCKAAARFRSTFPQWRTMAHLIHAAIVFAATGAIASAQSAPDAQPEQPLQAALHSDLGARSDALPDAPQPQAPVAATPSSAAPAATEPTLRGAPMDILRDQAAIWTSPAKLRTHDLKWAVPLGLAITVAVTADHQALASEVPINASFNHDNVLASDVLTGALVAVPVALIGKGELFQNPAAKEAGILGGEALVDGVVVEQGMKLIFWRERPGVDNAKGKFFQRSAGVDSSFPSSHSVLAWSSAAVLAEEYPAWWQQAGIYALATGVSITRVLGREHFPSDVLVGSAAGWMVGHYVFHKRHKVRSQYQ